MAEDRSVKITNTGNDPLLVNDRYLYPKQSRRIHRAIAARTQEKYGDVLTVAGGEVSKEDSGDDLTQLTGVGKAMAAKLNEAGYHTYTDLAGALVEEMVVMVDGLSEDKAASFITQAQERIESGDSDGDEAE